MPEAVCIDTGRELGYGTVPIVRSPFSGGAVRPFVLRVGDEEYTARQIHELFYGRSHVVFGWSRAERSLVVPWDHLADYCAAVVDDVLGLFGPGERALAYCFGWMTHVVGDSLIKSIRPGLTLDLLDGKYTPRNRPIQDLVTYHEIGRRELELDWDALLADVANTPLEPVQLHYMRVGPRHGELGKLFPDGWLPERQGLLTAVLIENRRWLRIWSRMESDKLRLRQTSKGLECDPELSAQAGGLTYAEMVRLAERAHFRAAMKEMGEAVADLFEAVVARVDRLKRMPSDDGPTWEALTRDWK